MASFSSGSAIENPQGDLITDPAGNIYGTGGSVFVLPTANRTPTVVASLNTSTTGADPYAGVTLDNAGDIFATTYYGGANGFGTVFEVPAKTSTPVLLATFDGTTTGGLSSARPVLDPSGNLFGTTSYGGTGGAGTVFEIAAGSHTIQTVVAFNGSNGSSPRSGLTADSAGDLFGTTYGITTNGAVSSDGTLFEIAANTHAFSTVVNFNGTNGAHPAGALLRDAAGNLYGTTTGGQGGALGYGSIFELPAGSSTIQTLAVFNTSVGQGPESGLTMDANGDLFGTAGQGPGAAGTVWELPAGSSTIQLLAYLSEGAGTGYFPDGGVALDSTGDIFGTATIGGNPGPQGTVFELVRVPEPGLLTLAAIGGIGLLRRRRA